MDIDYAKRITDDVSLSPISSSTLPSAAASSLPTPVPLSPTSSTSLSAMLIITYSKEFTIECYRILMSNEYTITQKILTIIRLLNNLMNMEQFFYLDLIITLFLSVYSFIITRDVANNTQQYQYEANVTAESHGGSYPYLPHAVRFYFVGNLVINSYFLWYFSYCRFLNGKDVITLRRSIQLLTHCFQFSSIGLLILCKERNNYITDKEVVGYSNCKSADDDIHCDTVVYGDVTFICTRNITITYSFRVIWHATILIKTLIDEYLSSFVISRGTIIDLLMVLFTPIGSLFSYLSNYHAKDFMRDMMRQLSVTYEMNNISRSTKYYEQMVDSYHSKAINVLLLLMIPISYVHLGDFFRFSEISTFYARIIGISVSFVIVTSYLLMVEYFLCAKNKYGTVVTVICSNLIVVIVLDCLLLRNYNSNLLCQTMYNTLLYAILLVVVVYQNRSNVSLYSTPMIMAKTMLLIIYTLIYCPLQPFISYICSFKYPSEISNTESKLVDKTNRIDENNETKRGNAYINIIKVPVLTLLSPIVDYYWENVEHDLKLSYPRYIALVTFEHSKFTISHHGSHYNVMIWVIVSIIMLILNETRSQLYLTTTGSPSPTPSPTIQTTVSKNLAKPEFFSEVSNRLTNKNWCMLVINMLLLMENFICKHNKYCNAVMISLISIIISIMQILICIEMYQDSTFTIYYIGFYLSIILSCFILYLIIVVYQNKDHISLRSMIRVVVIEFIQYWYYTLLYLPCQVIYSCIYYQNASNSSGGSKSIEGTSSKNDSDIKSDDMT